eukprot:5718099-Pyramimonas_sp.AAC.1
MGNRSSLLWVSARTSRTKPPSKPHRHLGGAACLRGATRLTVSVLGPRHSARPGTVGPPRLEGDWPETRAYGPSMEKKTRF